MVRSSRKVSSACFGWISHWKNNQNLHAAIQLDINITNSNRRQNVQSEDADKWVTREWFAGDVAKIRRHWLISGWLETLDVMLMQNHIPVGFPSTVSPLVCNYGVRRDVEGSVGTVMRTGRTGNMFSQSHMLATTRAAHRQSHGIIHVAGFNIQFCGEFTSPED